MKTTTAALIRELERRQLKYDCEERESRSDVVSLKFTGENLPGSIIKVFLGESGMDLTVACFSLVKVPQPKRVEMLELLNEVMDNYRWLKLYLDSDSEVTSQVDAIVDDRIAGIVGAELILRTVNILDNIYPRIMKIMWS